MAVQPSAHAARTAGAQPGGRARAAAPPRRRCVGCGRIAPKSELVRLALARHGAAGDGGSGGERSTLAVIDPAGTMPGRGAYLCRGTAAGVPAGECLALARRRGGIARALRCAVRIDPEIVESVSP
ncbi:MAG: YlxR family protein [Solirubrobacteraceae bacterium]